MSEKFFRSEPATSWSQHAALEAQGKRLDEAARERKKKAAALARREAARRAKAEPAKIVQDEQGAASTKLENEPIIVASTSMPPANQSVIHEEPVSSSTATNPLAEHQDLEGDIENEVGDYDWDPTGFYDDRALTSKQSSRRAVYEETQGRVGKRQAMETIGGRHRPGSKDLVRSNVDIVPVGPENAGWKKGDQTHFERVAQERARKATDLKRNARRGPSIRDLEEIPPSARRETFVRDMDELSRQYAVPLEGQTTSKYIPETRRERPSPLEKIAAKSRDNSEIEEDASGRKKAGRGPKVDRPFTGGRGRSSQRDANLSTDKVANAASHDRFTRQQNAQREERRTVKQVFQDMLDFFSGKRR